MATVICSIYSDTASRHERKTSTTRSRSGRGLMSSLSASGVKVCHFLWPVLKIISIRVPGVKFVVFLGQGYRSSLSAARAPGCRNLQTGLKVVIIRGRGSRLSFSLARSKGRPKGCCYSRPGLMVIVTPDWRPALKVVVIPLNRKQRKK